MSGVAGHDPWWGDVETGEQPSAPVASVRANPSARRRRTRRRTGIGWVLLGLVVAPFDRVRRRMRNSPKLRVALTRLAVVAAILAVIGGSVGVILINNVVIGRTAELGKLEDQRRELRRENAMLGAEAARAKVPGLVYKRATKDLGMVSTENVPAFIYLFDGSRELTGMQRRQIAANRRSAHAQDPADKDTP